MIILNSLQQDIIDLHELFKSFGLIIFPNRWVQLEINAHHEELSYALKYKNLKLIHSHLPNYYHLNQLLRPSIFVILIKQTKSFVQRHIRDALQTPQIEIATQYLVIAAAASRLHKPNEITRDFVNRLHVLLNCFWWEHNLVDERPHFVPPLAISEER
jgi:hypothetical protein